MADEPNAQSPGPANNPAETPAGEGAAPEAAAAPKPTKIEVTKENPYIWGTGRRKTAVARVRIRPGSGKFIVNKRELEAFFHTQRDRDSVRTPLNVAGADKTLDVFVNVKGGGTTGQAGAILLGLSRALIKANPDLLPALREKDLLTRDPRKVERKKYGQRGARRRFQFSKR